MKIKIDWMQTCRSIQREIGRCIMFATLKGFDVVLTSETIYNEEHYGVLHDLFDVVLPSDGLVLLAAKMFYFGVGGNIPSFLEYVKTRGVFDTYICWSSECNVPRKIIQLTRKFCS
uniref:Endonuclease/exonuclease/phosphatase n=1 Tax=Elaeophora elaphi TaxID=1147741 RepID=A0A0R3RMX8_9BILA